MFVLVAISMVAVISAAAIAIDIGMLITARTEAQRTADSAALAGAGALAVVPGDENVARAAAIDFANRNPVRHQLASVLPEDVTVDLVQSRVTVVVHRTSERGNPVGTFFARVFGVTSIDIRALATAEAADVGSDYEEACYLPLMLPDRWFEDDPELATWEDTWDPEEDGDDGVADTYVAPGEGDVVSGYTDDDYGEIIYLRKSTGGGGDFNPSWYFPWTPFGDEAAIGDDPGGDAYRSRFTSCMVGSYGPGSIVYTEPGAMVGPTLQGFDDLEALDPDAWWCEDCGPGTPSAGCVVRDVVSEAYPEDTGTDCVTNSPRVKPLPLFSPLQSLPAGRKELYITNTGYVFVHGKQGQDYIGYWLGGIVDPGTGGSGGPGPSAGPLPKLLRLIE